MFFNSNSSKKTREEIEDEKVSSTMRFVVVFSIMTFLINEMTSIVSGMTGGIWFIDQMFALVFMSILLYIILKLKIIVL